MSDEQDLKDERIIKSKQRVTDHGEVFTPAHLVSDMLDLVKDESERIDSRFLEPACGEGNFLVQVLTRKLATVQQIYGRNEFERRHYGLLALMCIYGIDILEDNVRICQMNLVNIFSAFIDDSEAEEWQRAAESVLKVNIIQANALTLLQPNGSPLTFPEWGYLGRGKYQRRDFSFESLTKTKNISNDSENSPSLFADWNVEDMFNPTQVFTPMTVKDLAAIRELNHESANQSV